MAQLQITFTRTRLQQNIENGGLKSTPHISHGKEATCVPSSVTLLKFDLVQLGKEFLQS